MPKSDNINHNDYIMAELFSAIYTVKEELKNNHLNNEITDTIINSMLKDYYTLEKYLNEKGVISNERNEK